MSVEEKVVHSLESFIRKKEKNVLKNLFRCDSDESSASSSSSCSSDNDDIDVDDSNSNPLCTHKDGNSNSSSNDECILHQYRSSGDRECVVRLKQEAHRGIAFQLWPAATYLCNYIEENQQSVLDLLSHSQRAASVSDSATKINVIELGAGIGLCGLFISSFLDDYVRCTVITDLPIAIDTINYNITLNASDTDRSDSSYSNCVVDGDGDGNKVVADVLSWGVESDIASIVAKYKLYEPYKLLIIAADCVYWECLFKPLHETITSLVINYNAVVLMAHVKRWKKDNKFFNLCRRNMTVTILNEVVDVIVDSSNNIPYRVVKRIYCFDKKI